MHFVIINFVPLSMMYIYVQYVCVHTYKNVPPCGRNANVKGINKQADSFKSVYAFACRLGFCTVYTFNDIVDAYYVEISSRPPYYLAYLCLNSRGYSNV
jgi:hypothetical protein